MPAGPLLLYDSALHALLNSSLPRLQTAPISALLLSPSHVVDLVSHKQVSDIEQDEVANGDYKRQHVTGVRLIAAAGGSHFSSDTIQFGNPITLGPAAYLALVFGLPNVLKDSNPLLGVAELSIGGAVEAQRSGFQVTPPSNGWFTLTRS